LDSDESLTPPASPTYPPKNSFKQKQTQTQTQTQVFLFSFFFFSKKKKNSF